MLRATGRKNLNPKQALKQETLNTQFYSVPWQVLVDYTGVSYNSVLIWVRLVAPLWHVYGSSPDLH